MPNAATLPRPDTRTVKERLPEILAAHAKHLHGEEECEGADLRGANLRDASLRYANLRGADLRYADLRGADLRGATGWIPLSETDHGYLVSASWHGDHWQIQAGCQNLTIEEARAHWGSPDYRTPSSGSRIVHMLDWLEKQPEPVKDDEGSAS